MSNMKKIICTIILHNLIGYAILPAPTSGTIIGDLPVSIAEDILSILTHTLVELTGNCTDTNNTSQVQYWLYTRDNPENYTLVNSASQIDASKPLNIIIHGWLDNADSDSLHVIKEAYLQRYDCSVISVNWEAYATLAYQTSYCYVPAVAQNVAKFICNVTSALNISLSSLHLVGHSLGAHVSGIAGKRTQQTCGTIGRITGLDPAGPLFQDISTRDRIYKTDARFVDIIHTNQGEFGEIGNSGDVDFYPNCGYQQPGCLKIGNISSVSDIYDFAVNAVTCSHTRSCYLFAESIISNAFYSTSCSLCGFPICFDDIIEPTHTYMGESITSQPSDTEYTLKTNGQSPYAQGPAGPLD